jgi:hypothetical protein
VWLSRSGSLQWSIERRSGFSQDTGYFVIVFENGKFFQFVRLKYPTGHPCFPSKRSLKIVPLVKEADLALFGTSQKYVV